MIRDTETLETLRREVGDDVVRELVALFATESRSRLETIETCRARRDLEGLSAAAHSMKGSSLNLGAARLAALCARLEKADDPEEIDALVPEVARELDRVHALFHHATL